MDLRPLRGIGMSAIPISWYKLVTSEESSEKASDWRSRLWSLTLGCCAGMQYLVDS